MASTSSINSSSSGSQAPNPPPRTHSTRPNQPPPPPPPLPSVPPVPPTRDSSITISKTAINKHSPISMAGQTVNTNPEAPDGSRFFHQFEPLFKPLSELPPPDPFMNKPKSYTSQRAQQNQNDAPKIQA